MARTKQTAEEKALQARLLLKEQHDQYLARQTAVLAQLEALTVMVQMHGERAAAREYPWDLIADLHHIRTHLNALLVSNAE
jgi:hypothetical protein